MADRTFLTEAQVSEIRNRARSSTFDDLANLIDDVQALLADRLQMTALLASREASIEQLANRVTDLEQQHNQSESSGSTEV